MLQPTYDHTLCLAAEKWLAELTYSTCGSTADRYLLYSRKNIKRFDWGKAWFMFGCMFANPGLSVGYEYRGLLRAMDIATDEEAENQLEDRRRFMDCWDITQQQFKEVHSALIK